ncbi:MAG: DUF3108 domain-containing protein [Chloroflexi bacterium]|nr:DUF3108 domain-containing protein [Chloroflexota bacterium]
MALRVARLFVGLSLLALAVAACESETVILSGQTVVSNIPWEAPEEARYRLMDGDDVRGSAILRIEIRDGKVIFTQEFESEEFSDEVEAMVDGETMRPRSVQRVVDGPEGVRRWQVEYEDGSALVVQRTEDDDRRDEFAVPTRSYDSWTDVFLWRTIDFREGYEATYADVLSATLAKPQVISQSLKVTGKETVEVPAGTFETWRLEIRSSDGTQRAWYADTETRPLIRYDNGSLTFELLSLR